MGIHAFVLALVCGAALLALWIIARFTNFGPRSVIWAIVHVVAACVLLRVVRFPLAAIGGSGIPAAAYVQLFGVALPLFVYGFLSGGWVGRAALGSLDR
jgi:hypothetical protein